MSRSSFRILIAVAGVVAAPSATAVVWPGAPPCNGTLQACIEAVAPGSVVELSNAIADENISITKNLTLRAASGKLGVIGGGSTARSVSVGSGGAAVNVQIRDLTLDNAAVSVDLFFGSGHQVTIHGCSIRNEINSNNTRGIDVDLRVPGTVTAEYNDIESNGNGISFGSVLSSGTVTAVARGNRITAVNPALSHQGIDIDLRGSGTAAVDVHNNLIRGVATCNCGAASGIGVTLLDDVTASIDIINNTLDDLGSSGLFVRSPPAGVSAGIHFFNNIVTRASRAVSFPSFAPGLLIASGFNDFFDNAFSPSYGGYPAGAGVVAGDPNYVNPVLGDYHLQEESAAVDTGTAVPPGGLPLLDADRKPRTIGAAPDMGAFEVPEPTGASGGVVAALVLAVLARRRGAAGARRTPRA